MNRLSLFMICTLLTVSQLTFPKKSSKSDKNGYVPLKHFHDAPDTDFVVEDKRSYLTEVINDTDCELKLSYAHYNVDCRVLECTNLNGDKSRLSTCALPGLGVTLPPRSRTILADMFIPVQSSPEDKGALVVNLIGEDKEVAQPGIGLSQIGDSVFGAYQFFGKLNTITRVKIVGAHSFSLIIKQMNDDLFFRSVRNNKLFFFVSSFRVDLMVNKRVRG
jgi:hypothetical protein